jgi:hypothetical protein
MANFSRLIPIASIFTPATLSVESKAMEPQPTHEYYVPTINFDTLSYVADLSAIESTKYNPQKLIYEEPSQSLKRLATAVGALGTALPISPPSSNSSWETEFRGPAIRCDPLSASESKAVEQNILEYVKSGDVCYSAPGYITWFGDLPYISKIPKDEDESTFPGAEPVLEPDVQVSSDGNASFRLAVLPALLYFIQLFDRQVPSICSDSDDVLGSVGNDTSLLLQCQLVNSTYSVAFEYVNGNQIVAAIEVPRTDLDEPVAAINTITGPTNETCVGFHAGYLLNQTYPPTEFPDWPERCDFYSGLARKLAYNSILDAFFDLISGSFTSDQSSTGNILATTLLLTRESSFLSNSARAMNSSLGWNSGLANLFEAGRTGRADVTGLIVPEPEDERPALARELEVMFQNITMSLMSSTTFQ